MFCVQPALVSLPFAPNECTAAHTAEVPFADKIEGDATSDEAFRNAPLPAVSPVRAETPDMSAARQANNIRLIDSGSGAKRKRMRKQTAPRRMEVEEESASSDCAVREPDTEIREDATPNNCGDGGMNTSVQRLLHDDVRTLDSDVANNACHHESDTELNASYWRNIGCPIDTTIWTPWCLSGPFDDLLSRTRDDGYYEGAASNGNYRIEGNALAKRHAEMYIKRNGDTACFQHWLRHQDPDDGPDMHSDQDEELSHNGEGDCCEEQSPNANVDAEVTGSFEQEDRSSFANQREPVDATSAGIEHIIDSVLGRPPDARQAGSSGIIRDTRTLPSEREEYAVRTTGTRRQGHTHLLRNCCNSPGGGDAAEQLYQLQEEEEQSEDQGEGQSDRGEHPR